MNRENVIRDARIEALRFLHDKHGIDSIADPWLEAFDICAAYVYNAYSARYNRVIRRCECLIWDIEMLEEVDNK